MIVLDGIQFKLFVKMFCHDKFLLQYDTFIVSLIDGMKSSHFDLYYLYSNTKKLAGLALVENSSGKHKGKTTISRRGRKRLRYLLFEVAMSLVAKNPEFRELHTYYTTRRLNPLKKMQSLMAVAAKLIRVFYAMLTKGVDYDPKKMVGDIRRPVVYLPAA